MKMCWSSTGSLPACISFTNDGDTIEASNLCSTISISADHLLYTAQSKQLQHRIIMSAQLSRTHLAGTETRLPYLGPSLVILPVCSMRLTSHVTTQKSSQTVPVTTGCQWRGSTISGCGRRHVYGRMQSSCRHSMSGTAVY